MMVVRIIAHGTVGTGDNAFTATGATIFNDAHDTGVGIFFDGLGIDRAGAQTSRPLAVLTSDRQEIEAGLIGFAEPDDAIAIFARAETMLRLARNLAAFAADAAFNIDHQGETAQSLVLTEYG